MRPIKPIDLIDFSVAGAQRDGVPCYAIGRFSARGVVAVLALLLGAGVAQATGPLAGAFVTVGQGVEILMTDRAHDLPVPVLGRLAPGTRLRLADGGRLQLLYLPEGRLESWQGRAVVAVGVAETQGLAIRTEPQVKRLPAAVTEALAASVLTLPEQPPRRAARRAKTQAPVNRLTAIQAQYAALREHSTEEDLLPELYLIAALEGVQAYADLQEPFDALVRKQPESPAIQALRQRYEPLLAAPPPPKPRTDKR